VDSSDISYHLRLIFAGKNLRLGSMQDEAVKQEGEDVISMTTPQPLGHLEEIGEQVRF